jgi:aminocarboxymuconate-semialdehyde decarboxylase
MATGHSPNAGNEGRDLVEPEQSSQSVRPATGLEKHRSVETRPLKAVLCANAENLERPLGRFDQGWRVRSGARAAQAKKPPSGYLKNIYYDNMIYRVDTIEYLRKLAGPDHIMVGTDYPYNLGDWKAVDKIEALDCPDSEKELMLEGNAKRLLKI